MEITKTLLINAACLLIPPVVVVLLLRHFFPREKSDGRLVWWLW